MSSNGPQVDPNIPPQPPIGQTEAPSAAFTSILTERGDPSNPFNALPAEQDAPGTVTDKVSVCVLAGLSV